MLTLLFKCRSMHVYQNHTHHVYQKKYFYKTLVISFSTGTTNHLFRTIISFTYILHINTNRMLSINVFEFVASPMSYHGIPHFPRVAFNSQTFSVQHVFVCNCKLHLPIADQNKQNNYINLFMARELPTAIPIFQVSSSILKHFPANTHLSAIVN